MVSMKYLKWSSRNICIPALFISRIQAPDITRGRNIKNTNGGQSTIMNEEIFRRMIYIVTKSNIRLDDQSTFHHFAFNSNLVHLYTMDAWKDFKANINSSFIVYIFTGQRNVFKLGTAAAAHGRVVSSESWKLEVQSSNPANAVS